MTAKEMWLLYTKNSKVDSSEYDAWAFGDESDELAKLVIEGKKTATASVLDLYAYDGERLPKAGDYSVILDSSDNAVCIIRDTDVSIVPFKDVDEEHARREGEGDLSLGYWRDVHQRLFVEWLTEADMKFSEDTMVVLEKFELVFKP